MRRAARTLAPLMLALAVAACSSGDGDDAANTPTAGGTPGVASPASGSRTATAPGSGTPFTVPAGTPFPTAPPAQESATILNIDASPLTPEIDAAATYPVGENFNVVVALPSSASPYAGYQLEVGWDPAVISFVNIMNIAREFQACSPVREYADSAARACLRADVADSSYTGPLMEFRLRCDVAGTSTLRLLMQGEGSIGTKVESRPDANIMHVLTTTEATITCA